MRGRHWARAGWIMLTAVLFCVLGIAWGSRESHRLDESLRQRLAGRAAARGPAIECPAVERSIRLLVLGQSNAANHGDEQQQLPPDAADRVLVYSKGHCLLHTDPLPGGTGTSGSIWSKLPVALAATGDVRIPVVSLLAVEATSVVDWTRSGSPLREALEKHLKDMKQVGFRPDAVLWQQGEADAAEGVGSDTYSRGLVALRSLLREADVTAPLLLARSTRCRLPAGHTADTLRAVQDVVAASYADVRIGPDTDLLGPEFRWRDCHFNAAGLREAARMWALSLKTLVH